MFRLRNIVRVGSIVLIVFAITQLLREPSHEREWQPYQSVMSQATVTEDVVTITNIRDWKHTATTSYDQVYLDSVSLAPDDIKQVWFTIQPFSSVPAVGHTMLTFELQNGEAYTLSIEARRESGEEYHSFLGLFREYELYYSWGTARDFLGVRLLFLDDDLYHYPLELSQTESWQLVSYMAEATHSVYQQPRFYNTLTANCTNLLAKAVNANTDNSLPYHYAWNLPGYSDTYLQREGYLSSEIDLALVRSKPGLQSAAEELQAASVAEDDGAFTAALRNASLTLIGRE